MKLSKIFITVTAVLSIFLSACSKATTTKAFPAAGVQLTLPSDAVKKGLVIETYSYPFSQYNSLYAFFQYAPALEALEKEMNKIDDESMSESIFDEYFEKMKIHYKHIASLILIPEEEYKSIIESEDNTELNVIKTMEKIGNRNNYIYLMSINTNTTEGMSKEEKDFYNYCVKNISASLKQATLIDIKNETSEN